ncbi:hypothetical protein [Silvibacterium acidisoli]|uniref:hypothetical protein n=1 Tax=Acidobacteriaceae bacterium ZG23-2 TaxID=2883246 RepID=UPI00406CA1B9
MDREQAWMIWAPEESQWGRWTKPALFSFLPETLSSQSELPIPDWSALSQGDTAVLVELPGPQAVIAGLQFARFGYRPIALFNASPFAPEIKVAGDGGFSNPIVDVARIVWTIEGYSASLEEMHLPASAPPAFLIDANRSRGPLFPGAGMFDNRSVVWETDLPEAEDLQRAGIRRVVLVQTNRVFRYDLVGILLSWQTKGIEITTQAFAQPWSPRKVVVKSPGKVAVLIRTFVKWIVFKTNSFGAFGNIAHPSGG